MAFSPEEISSIYDRTSGYCHLCRKKVAFKNYGALGARGAWEVEHSVPKVKGGTDHLNNLYPACISCNRSKGATSTRAARGGNGLSRAPLSVERRKSAKERNALIGGATGGAIGALFGPIGAILGAAFGAGLAHKKNPDQ
jgi:hypothetical protein